jgi:hypothetical protein
MLYEGLTRHFRPRTLSRIQGGDGDNRNVTDPWTVTGQRVCDCQSRVIVGCLPVRAESSGGGTMTSRFEEELPSLLRFNPHFIADPVPWWWLREQSTVLQRELTAIRIEAMQQMHQVQADAMAKAAGVLRNAEG